MTEPNENGNYTEQEWDRLPIAQRMRLCASGEYEIYPTDMIHAASRIEKLEVALQKIIQEDALTGKTVFVGDFGKIARKALEGKDGSQTDL